MNPKYLLDKWIEAYQEGLTDAETGEPFDPNTAKECAMVLGDGRGGKCLFVIKLEVRPLQVMYRDM